jgi:hypothetical protein
MPGLPQVVLSKRFFMFQQLFNKLLLRKRIPVMEVLDEITLFYSNLNENKEVIDEWCFSHVFNTDYCNYLKNYSWLEQEKLDYLHQGVLNLVLFKMFSLMGNNKHSSKREMHMVLHRIDKFTPLSIKTKKLAELTKRSISILNGNTGNKNEINKIISWTLNNIILSHKPSQHEFDKR